METSLKKFGLNYEKFLENQEIIKSFYNDLAKLYSMADLNTEMMNSYGQAAIRAFYNGDIDFIDKLLSEGFGSKWQGIEDLAKTLTDIQKSYVTSEKFISDINNIRKVFPSDFVNGANSFMKNAVGFYKDLEPIKYMDFISGLKIVPGSDLAKISLNLIRYLLPTESLETGKAKYKFEDPITKNAMNLSIENIEKSQLKYDFNNLTRNFQLNGSNYKISNKTSFYSSLNKKFGIENSAEISNETLGISSKTKYGFNFKDNFYVGQSISSKALDVDFKASEKDVSFESKFAVTNSVKVGSEFKMDLEGESVMPTVNIKSKIDLKNANMGDLVVYSIIKPVEKMHNIFMDYTKEAVDNALESDKEDYTENTGVNEELNEIVNQEFTNSLDQVFESEIMDEKSRQILDEEYQQLISEEVESIEVSIQVEQSENLEDEVHFENDQGYSI